MNIRIQHHVDDWLLTMRLLDMRCKHALRTSDKGEDVIRLSSLIGYEIAEWGLHSNHLDIKYHADVIMKMEEDDYNHPERIVVCRYPFMNKPCIWLDNLHSAVHYVRKYGPDVRLKDIPFYVVDLSGAEPVIYENGLFDKAHLEGAVKAAKFRQTYSNSEELISLYYTLEDFLSDNPILLTCTEYFGTDGAVRGPKDRKQIAYR